MKPFTYLRARSVDTVLAAATDRNRILSGGIDLLGELKEGLVEADQLIAVTRIPGLDQVTRTPSGWTIGATTSIAALAAHGELSRAFPGLAEAAAHVASPQIRHVSTVAGNLLQHSRCWYYRHRDIHCLKKGGDVCYARDGEHKYHCLFSGSWCISPLVSNLATSLATLDATVVVRQGDGERRLTIAQLYAPAWDDPEKHHAIGPREMVTAIEIPFGSRRSAFLQASEKAEFDWALVSCAVSLDLDDTGVRDARIALGAVAPVPYRSERAEAALLGQPVNDTTATRAADLLLADAEPLPQNAYKLPIARALIRRALVLAASR